MHSGISTPPPRTLGRAGTIPLSRTALAIWAIASPLLLLIVSQEWLFTPQGFLDPWDYVGFFLNYGEPEYYPYAYKVARLPWILSGWIAHRVFPSPAAEYLLHAGYLLLATAGFWLLLNELFHSVSVASIGTLLLGFYTHFHGSGGWDYHNTAAGAYYVWAMFALSRSATHRTRSWLFGAGALTALAIHANVTLVNMLPVLALHFLYIGRSGRPRVAVNGGEGLRISAWLFAGAAISTGALMFVSLIAGRNPVFFQPLVDMVIRFITDPRRQAEWWQPWSAEWLLNAKHLSLLFAATLASATGLILARRSHRLRIHRLVWVEFLALIVVWMFWQAMGQTSLNWDYFAFPLIPHALLAAAALVAARHATSSGWLLAIAPLVLAAPLIFAFHAVLLGTTAKIQTAGIAVPASGLFLIGFACLLLTSRLAIPAFLVMFGVANADAATGWDRYAAQNTCRIGAELSGAVIGLNRFLAGFDARLHKTSLWFQQGEMLALAPGCALNVEALGRSLQASGVPNIADNPYPMPAAQGISATALRDLAAKGNRLAVLSADPRAFARVELRAGELGLTLGPVATRRVAFRGHHVIVTLADVRSR
jgi:hypothetical protein